MSTSTTRQQAPASLMWEFLVTNKFLIPVVCVLLAAILILFPWELKESGIDAQLESGTIPAVLPSTVQINRPDIIKQINESFIQHTKTNLFGVILGPSGSGKTYLTRLICNQETAGVLYFEISDPSFFPERLACKIGMKLMEDTSVIDVLRESIGIKSWINFYRLPTNFSLALSYVLEKLAERGANFQRNRNRMPCLFIDGVEKLARKYPKVMVNLIDLAKYYANNGMLRIVLVGPLLESTPSQIIWRADIIEILDIDGENTLRYLTQNGLPATLGERVVNFTGGRFALLNKAIEIYDKHEALKEDDIFQQITNHLKIMCYGNKAYIYDTAERVLINHFSMFDKSTFWPQSLHTMPQYNMSREESNMMISGLLELDILRYTSAGYTTWHNKVVRDAVLKRIYIYKMAIKELNLTNAQYKFQEEY